MTDVTLHIDEDISAEERENFLDALLGMNGVIAAACHDKTPHLMIIEYDRNAINSMAFVKAAQNHGLRAELLGL
jgi:hypothetical protein